MNTQPKWQYDEMKHRGVDYANKKQVEVYDKRHQKFRDYDKEAQNIIDQLVLGADDTIIDFGCGTGAFTLYAAKYCKTIFAVDVSQVMLDYTKQKAQKEGLENIEFCHGGFLTYEHNEKPVDAIVSVMALHHLPDFWKLIALSKLAAMLKSGGKLYLFDVVFSFDVADYKICLDNWGKLFAETMEPEFVAEVQTHIREEFSTCDWIMEGLLERAGFEIELSNYKDDFLATYLCTKKS
jgi:putative AdoMet-dependent methyltransferase